MEGYTEEELALLTDEERAALNEPDTVEEEEEELEEKPVVEPAEEPVKPVKAEPETPAAAEPAPAAAAEPEKSVEQEVVAPRPRGVLNDTLPDDYQQRVDNNVAAMKELRKKYNDGDISFDEYEEARDQLSDEKQDLREIKLRAEISDQSASSSLQEQWDGTMGDFLKEHPESIATPVRQNAFDQLLREITKPIMAKGGMPGRAEIDKAYAQLAKEFGLEPKKAEPAPAAEKQPVKVPPVLGGLPASSATDTEDGRWAQLDRLMDSDPERHEEELKKLSSADYDAYMAAR